MHARQILTTCFERLEEFENGAIVLGAHTENHIYISVFVALGRDADDMDSRGQNMFEVRENLRPRESALRDQAVQIDGAADDVRRSLGFQYLAQRVLVTLAGADLGGQVCDVLADSAIRAPGA